MMRMVRSPTLLGLLLAAVSMSVLSMDVSSCDSSEGCPEVIKDSAAMLQLKSRETIMKNLAEDKIKQRGRWGCGDPMHIDWDGQPGKVDAQVWQIASGVSWGTGCDNCVKNLKAQGFRLLNPNCAVVSGHGVWLRADNIWKPTVCPLKLNNLKTPNPLVDPTANTFEHTTSSKLEFSNVCSTGGTDWDLLVTITDYTGKYSRNRVVGDMFELNVKQGDTATLKFDLKKKEKTWTDAPIPLDDIFVSVLDVDQQPGIQQIVVARGFSNVTFGSEVTKTKVENVGYNNVYKFFSQRNGNAADNPTDPMHLSEKAKSSTVSFKYSGVSGFSLGLVLTGTAESGRSFMLGGATELMSP